MTLLQLQYFQVLAKILHYTKAAKELHISQPSLSYAIGELEKELGVPLFEKDKRTISLSPYGYTFLEYVNQSLAMLEKGVKNITSIKNASTGVVSIGYIYSLSTTLIPQIVETFKKESGNNIKFKFTQNLQTELVEALLSGKIDLALSGDTNSSIVSVPLFEQELYVMVSEEHPLAKVKSIDFKDIVNEPFILLDSDSALRQMLDTKFKEIHVVPNIISEAHECGAALQYVAHNAGITIIPDTPSMESLPIVKIPIKTHGFKRKIYLSWNNEQFFVPPVRKVRNYILQFFLNGNQYK